MRSLTDHHAKLVDATLDIVWDFGWDNDRITINRNVAGRAFDIFYDGSLPNWYLDHPHWTPR